MNLKRNYHVNKFKSRKEYFIFYRLVVINNDNTHTKKKKKLMLIDIISMKSFNKSISLIIENIFCKQDLKISNTV